MAEELKILAAHFGADMSDASIKKAMRDWNDFAGYRQAGIRGLFLQD